MNVLCAYVEEEIKKIFLYWPAVLYLKEKNCPYLF